MKKVLPLVTGLIVLLAACGPKATPTMDSAQVMDTAVAMANTIAAQTQAAMPTDTPIPTETATLPPPSPTFALPTFPPLDQALPTATTASSGGACSGLMAPDPAGPKVYLVIDNKTKGQVTFSLYLNETAFACGFVRGVSSIGSRSSISVTVPQGCYWPSAYVNDPKKPASLSGPQGCIQGSDKITLVIDYDAMRWVFP